MGILKAIQTGSATLAAANTTVNVAITAVTLAKTFLQFTYKGSADRAPRTLICGRFTSTTNILFERKQGSSASDYTIQWQVLEFTSGVSVQSGTNSAMAVGNNDIAISAVTVAQSWPIISYMGNNNFDNNGKDRYTAELTTTTNLRLNLAVAWSGAAQINWQVIQYTGSSVQKITRTHVDTATEENVAITSIPMRKTAVFDTMRCNSTSFNIDSADKDWLAYLEASNNVRFKRGNNNGGAGWGATKVSIAHIVTFPDVKVTRFQKDMDAGNTSTTQSVTITSTSRASINNTSIINSTVCYSQIADIDHPRFFVRAVITSSTVITWDRQVSGDQITIYWELLEWDQRSGFFMFFEPF